MYESAPTVYRPKRKHPNLSRSERSLKASRAEAPKFLLSTILLRLDSDSGPAFRLNIDTRSSCLENTADIKVIVDFQSNPVPPVNDRIANVSVQMRKSPTRTLNNANASLIEILR